MEKLVAGVVEYAPLDKSPSERFSNYVQRNVKEYERIVEEAVTQVDLISKKMTRKDESLALFCSRPSTFWCFPSTDSPGLWIGSLAGES